MVNTAAIRAAVDGKEWVSMAEFEYSHDKHVLGTDWKSRVSCRRTDGQRWTDGQMLETEQINRPEINYQKWID